MMMRNLPADELCLHAISTYLNLHITVDYHGGFWTTLNIPNIHHDLATILSDVHLAYRGFCRYGLLCKNTELKITGRMLMEHKTQHNQKSTKKPELLISLCRVEEWNNLAEKLLNEELSSLELSKLDMYTSGTTTTKTENDNTDSDSTEPYDIYENIIGTIYYYTPLPSATNSGPQLSASQMTKDGASTATHLPFKCPMRNCKTRAKKTEGN